MGYFDLPLEQLKQYCPPRTEPEDFDAFWANTLADARQFPTELLLEEVDFGLELVETYDVTFNGFGGQPVKGWLTMPRNAKGKLPAVIFYHGYTCGRGLGFQYQLWAAAGFMHFVMDTRGQGSSLPGDTPDQNPTGGSPHTPGFMTDGIFDPRTYYYRRLFTDAVRYLDAVLTHPQVDADRLAVEGGSQGGGIALAASGLAPEKVKLTLCDVPFLCHFRRAVEITDSYPYQEIVQFCRANRASFDQVMQTLDYFDGVNFAARARSQALFSVGLMDDVCPPSTVFAAFNHFGSAEKEIRVYPFNRHEGGGPFQDGEKLKFLTSVWKKG